MRSVVTTLLIAVTALVWLFVVTLSAEANQWGDLLHAFALFLSAVCVGRLAEVFIAGLIDDRRTPGATDLVRAMSSVVIYLGVLISWLYFGLGVNVTGLLATSAVVSVVLGFALQTTLGNLFAGLSLELERPIRVGDYLRKPPHDGTIVALKWRSIHIKASNGSLVVLPNSALAAAPVEVIPKSAPVLHTATFHVSTDHPPVLVLGLIQQALSSGLHPGILGDPAPSAVLIGTEARSATALYGARFYTDQPGVLVMLSSIALTRIWYLLSRSGISMTGRPSDACSPVPQAPYRFLPGPVPPALIAAGRSLHFGPGEILPSDLAGIVINGGLHEEYLEHEFDLWAAVQAVTDAETLPTSMLRLEAAACAVIAGEAALFLGPIAATLTDRFASETEDPYLVYHAVATRIPTPEDRHLFLAGAPSRPVRRLSVGDCFGWPSLLRLEAAATRACSAPAGAEVLVFTRPQLQTLLKEPAGDALINLLRRNPHFDDLGPVTVRQHLEHVAG